MLSKHTHSQWGRVCVGGKEVEVAKKANLSPYLPVDK